MLTMTETAADAVKSIVSRAQNVPTEGGLRISETAPEKGFDLSVTTSPEPTDTVVSADGAHVFLDATAAETLDARVLDAEVAPDGSVRFALANQP